MANASADKPLAGVISSVIELLKYPLTVFSILIALILGKSYLGITFGPITEVSSSGIKFGQDAKGEIADLAGKLNGALKAIEELNKSAAAKSAKSPVVQATVFEATQTVSDQTAQFAKLPTGQMTEGPKPKGFIWVGDYENGWDRVKLGTVDTGQPITAAPTKLLPGTEYRVLANMVVRDGLPSNDAEYFRSRKSLGIVSRGTKVRLVRSPVGINREFAVQYWAEVELPC
jgi:hypothetical protein